MKTKKGEPVPIDWIHPDDVIFKDGSHVQVRGGDDPAEAQRAAHHVARLRDLYMLQAAKDERCFDGPLEKTLIFLSSVLAALANKCVPNRMQLDDEQYYWQYYKNTTLKLRELKSRLRKEWTDLGHPEWADVLTPALSASTLARLCAWDPAKV